MRTLKQSLSTWQTLPAWPFWFGGATVAGAALPATLAPTVWGGGIFFCLCVGLFQLIRHKQALPLVAAVICGIAAAWSAYTHHQLTPPDLPGSYIHQRVWVTGQIAQLEQQPNRTRITLRQVTAFSPPHQPRELTQIRISTTAHRLQNAQTGDWWALQVKFLEPPQNSNFDRESYLKSKRLDATAVLWGEDQQLYNYTPPQWRDWLNRTRYKLAQHYQNQGEQGALAASLMVGERSQLPQEVKESFRRAGLAHLLAISGLHVGLVAALGLVLGRSLLIRLPAGVGIPVKTIAGIGGGFLALGYAALAGFALPTIRAATMLAVAYITWMTGRYQQGLRALALIAGVLVWLWPLNVVSPSFQMSFIATFVLLLWGKTNQNPRPPVRWLRAVDYLKTIFVVSLLAGVATLPISLWHFGQVSLNGLLANLLAIPVLAFWVLPAGLVDLALMNSPLAQLSWAFLASSLAQLAAIAEWAGGLPLANLTIPLIFWPLVALLSAACVLSVCFAKAQWTLLSFITLLGTFAAFHLMPRPAAVWWQPQEGALIYANSSGGQVLYHNGKNLNYLLKELAQEDPRLAKTTTHSVDRCDASGCMYTFEVGRVLLLQPGYLPTPEDCRSGALIIAQTEAEVQLLCGYSGHKALKFEWHKGKGWDMVKAL